ncbi:hypothetical protein LXN57_46805 [Actinoplanes sp. TRM88002]|uniref:Uncharacterized protein n=1 Tax=Paractinoplanes hotanensis TaxID=2906497 RepID=A0ABT0YG77_9ACTN|nr:hypothetical protein [Actinoplanes hotanensis]MCM4085063.1 hypothetical protein [Actinoplanes hotanensis]
MSQVRGLDAVAGRRTRRGLRIAALDETGQAKQPADRDGDAVRLLMDCDAWSSRAPGT